MLEDSSITDQHHHKSDAYIPFSEREKPYPLSFPWGSMVQNICMCSLTIIKKKKKIKIQNVPF